jgi:hypothetical protein
VVVAVCLFPCVSFLPNAVFVAFNYPLSFQMPYLDFTLSFLFLLTVVSALSTADCRFTSCTRTLSVFFSFSYDCRFCPLSILCVSL